MEKVVAYILGVLVVGFLLACIQAVPVYFAWNYLIERFHIPRGYELSFWDALVVSILASSLFKSSSSSSKKD